MTDTTVIQPGAGQSILTTEHHDRHGHGGHGDFRETRLDADYRSLVAQGERYGTINGDRINGVGTLVQSGMAGVHDRLCDATGKVIHEIDRHGDAAALAACRTNDAIAETKLATAVGFKDQIIAQNVGFSAQSVLSTTIGNAAQVQATTNANALSVEATKNFYALSVEAVKNASASQLEAQKNAATAAAQLAECCCKMELQAAANTAALQASILAQGQAGRDLANEIEARRVQNELQRLQTQVLVLTGGLVGGAAAARG